MSTPAPHHTPRWAMGMTINPNGGGADVGVADGGGDAAATRQQHKIITKSIAVRTMGGDDH